MINNCKSFINYNLSINRLLWAIFSIISIIPSTYSILIIYLYNIKLKKAIMKYKVIKIKKNLVIKNIKDRNQIKNLIENPPLPPFVELDLSGIKQMDSTGIGLINKLSSILTRYNGTLKISNVNQHIYEILDICGITSLVNVGLN